MSTIRDMEKRLTHGVEPGVYGEIYRTRPGDVPMVASHEGAGSITPIGSSSGDRTLDLIQGLDGIITKQQAALREADRVAKDMAIVAERTAKFLGNQVQRSIQGELSLEGFQRGIGFSAEAPSVAQPSHRTWDEDSPPSGPMDDTFADDAGKGHVPRLREQRRGRPEPAPSGIHTPTSWEEGKEMFAGRKGFSLSSVRQQAAETMSHRLSEWNLGANVAQDSMGRWHYAAGEVVDGASVGGRFIDASTAQHALHARALSTAVKKGVSGVAESGSLMQGVNAAIPAVGKAAGVAGAVWYGGNQLLDFAESQRAQNTAYQQVLGGDNAEGFGERFSENVFRWSQRGIMGSREAEALYRGSLDIYGTAEGGGYDHMRTEAQNTGTRLYKEAGMSPDETLRFVRMAARSGSESLKELGDALIATSRAARDAGVNAKEARGYFGDIYKNMAQFGSAGAMAAGAQASAQAQWGEQGAMWDFSNLQSSQGIYAASAMLGITPNELIGKQSTASGQLEVTQVQEQRAKSQLRGYISTKGWQMIKQRFPSGKPNNMTDAAWTKFAQKMLAEGGIEGNIIQLAPTLRAMGFPNIPEGGGTDTAVPTAVGLLRMILVDNPFGGGDENLTAAAAQEQEYAQRISSGEIKSDWGEGGTDSYLNDLGVAREGGMIDRQSKNYDRDVAAMQYANITSENLGDERLGTGRNVYAEKLIEDFDQEANYIVDTKDGPREVGFEELLRYYRDQLETGDVWISSGENRGQRVADLFGGVAGEGAETESAQTDPGRTGTKVDDFETTRDTEGLDKIVVEVRPSGNLQGFIETQVVGGGVGADQSQGTSSSTATVATSRPTGKANGW